MERDNKICELRQEREVLRFRANSITEEIERMLNAFALDEGETMITFDQLKASKNGELLKVNEKVQFEKYYEDDNVLKFKSYLKSGGIFGIQQHDCLEEVHILQGNLIEALRGDKMYKKGSIVTYLDNELHKPYCTVDSIYNVIFTKKK